jgi:hypothetical protein
VSGHRVRFEKVAVMRTVQDVVKRLRAEYLQVPGLRLTVEQVQRLCGIERMMSESVLDALVDARFLTVTSDGSYTHVMEGEAASHGTNVDRAAAKRFVKTS